MAVRFTSMTACHSSTRKLDSRLARHASGVVHQDVDAAESFGDERERLFHGRLFGDVDRQAAERQIIQRLDVEPHHARPRVLEHAHRGGANAFRAAGDNRSFSVEAEEIHDERKESNAFVETELRSH